MYDVIVIGAGNGGLMAATELAKAGKKVLLLEQHNMPGGFASSFVRGRFEFEPALHELTTLDKNGSLSDLGKAFSELSIKVKWHSVPEAFHLFITDDGDENVNVTMPFGINNFIEAMKSYMPDSEPYVRKYFALLNEISEGLDYISQAGDKLEPSKLIKLYPNLVKVAPLTLTEVENVLEIPDKVRAVLNAYWCYLGVVPDKLDFFIYAAMCQDYLQRGAVVPEMRSHEISSAILSKFYEYGGTAWFNSKVDKIIMANNTAKGVVVRKESIFADEIISNASPHTVFSSLIDSKEVPTVEKKRCNSRNIGLTGFSIYVGLNKSAEELGLTDYSYILMPSSHSAKLTNIVNSPNGRRPIATTVLNNAVPDCSPKGTCIFSITTLFGQKALFNIDSSNYFQEKTRIARELIAYFEEGTGIAISPYIEEISVASPLTYASYTGAYNGSIYGYDTIPDDSVISRQLFFDKDRSINNLWFVGGFGFRAHGYSSSYQSGIITAKKILTQAGGKK